MGGRGVDLLDRDQELAQVDRALADVAASAGCALLFEGPAGIGKTSLARVLCARAEHQGMTVGSARGGELERAFPYGVVRQLFEPLLLRASAPERASLLDGAAAMTARVLAPDVAGPDPEEALADAGPILHGFYWLVSNLSERAPLVLSIDDAHWADEPSLQFLHYLVRRLDRLPVLVALTERRPETGSPRAELARLAAEPACRIVRPGPLGLPAATRMVQTVVGADPARGFAHACHVASGGNPLLLDGLLQEVSRLGIPPTEDSTGAVERLAPEAVTRSVLLRLARLPASCEALARAVAIMGPGTALSLLADLADLDPAGLAAAADALAAAGILEPSRSLQFVHPLLREAVYAAMPAGERAIAHRRAAAILDRDGAPGAAVAAQLLATDGVGDPWTIDVLRRAADEALRGGQPASAVRFLERALDEGAVSDRRVDLLMKLGVAQARAADKSAMATLAEALRLGADPHRRVEVALQLARAAVAWMDLTSAADILDGLRAEALDEGTAVRVEAERLRLRVASPMDAEPIPSYPDVAPLADGPGAGEGALMSTLAMLAVWHGEPVSVVQDHALRAFDVWSAKGDWPYNAHQALLFVDAFDAAAAGLDATIEEGRRLGSQVLFGAPMTWRAQLRYRLGLLDEAEADCRVVMDIMAKVANDVVLSLPSFTLADVLVERGDLDGADAVLAAVAPGPGGHYPWFLDTRGRLRTAQGRLSEAVEDLTRFVPLAERFRGPCFVAWRSSLADALHKAGEQAKAIALASEEVQLARRQGAPRALGLSLRTLGRITADRRPLQEAVEVLAGSPAVLARAHALCDLGAAIRRAGDRKEARTPLREALDLADRCGAVALVERAREELAAAGARPRRIATTGAAALTASERRVAKLAADGMSNRQIAQSLFVSMATVATHLTAVYQKLEVKGRAELRDGLALDADDDVATGSLRA